MMAGVWGQSKYTVCVHYGRVKGRVREQRGLLGFFFWFTPLTSLYVSAFSPVLICFHATVSLHRSCSLCTSRSLSLSLSCTLFFYSVLVFFLFLTLSNPQHMFSLTLLFTYFRCERPWAVFNKFHHVMTNLYRQSAAECAALPDVTELSRVSAHCFVVHSCSSRLLTSPESQLFNPWLLQSTSVLWQDTEHSETAPNVQYVETCVWVGECDWCCKAFWVVVETGEVLLNCKSIYHLPWWLLSFCVKV